MQACAQSLLEPISEDALAATHTSHVFVATATVGANAANGAAIGKEDAMVH